MKNNKGITLIELLAVLAIIALLALIVYPIVSSVIKDSTSDTTKATNNSIKEAAEMYVTDKLETTEINSETVTLEQLSNGGYLTIDENKYDLESSNVVINKEDDHYTYTITLNKK